MGEKLHMLVDRQREAFAGARGDPVAEAARPVA
jgi:hypothetical protein